MKTILKKIYSSSSMLKACFAVALAAVTLTGCSPEEYEGPNEAGLPSVNAAKARVEVDQTTNGVTFYLDNKGEYPIWLMPQGRNTTYSTVNGQTVIFTVAGDYKIPYRVGNRNGISDGTDTLTFHINNSIVNFDQYYNLLAGGSENSGKTKEWRIASSVAGHLACGEYGTTGNGWYSAQPNEKGSFGLYDDRLTFSTEKGYVYEPGTSGTVYVNKDASYGNNPHSGSDYTTPVSRQTADYRFEVEGTSLYLVLPANTLFPYISADAQYSEPRFRVENITATQLDLVYDNPNKNISWHFILTSGQEGFQGFNADSNCNLWKNCTYNMTFFYAPGWAQIAAPGFSANGNSYTISLPTATTQQWQAQCKFHTDMTTNSSTRYDFSAKFLSTKDHNSVTVKLVKEGDDNTFYFTEVIKLKAYEPYVFYKSDMPGIDMNNVTLVLDFGGNEAGTDVTVSRIDLQEHGCDGIVAPAEDTDRTVYVYNATSNLWKTRVDDRGTAGFTTRYYYAPGWAQIANPVLTFNAGTFSYVLPQATSARWQAQCFITTDIAGEANTKYDFSCKLNSDKAGTFMVKLTDTASGDNFLFAKEVTLRPYEEYTLKVPAVMLPNGAAASLELVLDFGGNEADTHVSASNIILQKTAI